MLLLSSSFAFIRDSYNDHPTLFIVCQESLKPHLGQVLVAHACNPSYTGGRDQEDLGSKPAWANSLRDPIWKTPNQKQVWWSLKW
jgi:hypothetical protein